MIVNRLAYGRLGAVELVELGNAYRHRELFPSQMAGAVLSAIDSASAYMGDASLGDVLGDVFGFLFKLIGLGIKTLTDVLKIPLDLLGQGTGFIITNLADFMRNIPVIGDMVAVILLAANAVIQFAISIPQAILSAIGNLGQAFASLAPDTQKAATQKAVETITKSAPPSIQPQVHDTVANAPPPGSTTTAGGGGFPLVPVLVGTGITAGAIATALFV